MKHFKLWVLLMLIATFLALMGLQYQINKANRLQKENAELKRHATNLFVLDTQYQLVIPYDLDQFVIENNPDTIKAIFVKFPVRKLSETSKPKPDSLFWYP